MLADFEAEQEGILAWLVEGCRQFLAHGLAVPQRIKAATADYRGEFDCLGTFIADRCDTGRGVCGRFTELYRELSAWLEKGGLPQITIQELARQLTARGFPREKRGGVVFRKGIDVHLDVIDAA